MKTVKCILRKDKVRADGTCPIGLQIILDRKVSRASVGIFCHPNDFDFERGYVKRSNYNHEELNDIINKAIAKELNQSVPKKDLLQEILQENEQISKRVDAAVEEGIWYNSDGTPADESNEWIKESNKAGREAKRKEKEHKLLEAEKETLWSEHLKSKNKPAVTQVAGLLKTFEDHITLLKAEQSVGTATNYNSTKNKLVIFLNNKDVPLNEINVQWLKAFDGSMIKEGLTVNSRYKHMKHLRKLLGQAYREGSILESPFKRYRLKTESVEKNFLTEAQLAQLEEMELSGTMYQHKLFYLFSLYSGGLRIRDALQLKNKHIRDGRLVLKTGKTGTDVGFKLLPKALQILAYFNQLNPNSKPDDYIFPFLKSECQKMKAEQLFRACSSSATMVNKSLAKMAKRMGLNHRMNFHSSRHSFATLALSKGMRIEYIGKVMGHKDIKVTQQYAKLISKDIDDALSNAFGS